jgi:hypothetical protein
MLHQLIAHAAKIWDVQPELVTSESQLARASHPRIAVCYIAYRKAGYKADEIAAALGRHRSTVVTAAQRAIQMANKSPIFAQRLEKLNSLAAGLLRHNDPEPRGVDNDGALSAFTAHMMSAIAQFRATRPDAFEAALLLAKPDSEQKPYR